MNFACIEKFNGVAFRSKYTAHASHISLYATWNFSTKAKFMVSSNNNNIKCLKVAMLRVNHLITGYRTCTRQGGFIHNGQTGLPGLQGKTGGSVLGGCIEDMPIPKRS